MRSFHARPTRSRSPRRHDPGIVRCGELPKPGPLLDHVGRQAACRLARGAGVTLKFIRDVSDDHAGRQFPRVQHLGTQGRVLIETSVNGRMQLPDFLPAFFVAADDIHERAIFVEEDRQRIYIMRVPCGA